MSRLLRYWPLLLLGGAGLIIILFLEVMRASPSTRRLLALGVGGFLAAAFLGGVAGNIGLRFTEPGHPEPAFTAAGVVFVVTLTAAAAAIAAIAYREGRRRQMEGERGVLYRAALPVGDGAVMETALREAPARVLAAPRASRPALLDEAGPGGAGSDEEDPAGKAPVLKETAWRAASPVWLRWQERGRATPLVLPSPVEGRDLALLREALARRGMELVAAVPYPARDERARPLDGLAGMALQWRLELTMCLRRMASAAPGTGAYVTVPVPPGWSEESFLVVGQVLAVVGLAADVLAGSGRIYLRLPAGIEALAPYLEGGWLERAAAGWIEQLLIRRGLTGVEVATQARVRLRQGREAEVDVVAVAEGRLVVAECSVGALTLLNRARKRQRMWSKRRLPGDVVLTVCVLGGDEEMERLREAYGWPAWRPAQGLEALERIIRESSDGGR
jgi:hypothetical protein